MCIDGMMMMMLNGSMSLIIGFVYVMQTFTREIKRTVTGNDLVYVIICARSKRELNRQEHFLCIFVHTYTKKKQLTTLAAYLSN